MEEPQKATENLKEWIVNEGYMPMHREIFTRVYSEIAPGYGTIESAFKEALRIATIGVQMYDEAVNFEI